MREYERFGQARSGTFGGEFLFENDGADPTNAGFAYANAFLGHVTRYTESMGRVGDNRRQNTWAWFVQDTWRLNRKLTVDVGLRMYGQSQEASEQLSEALLTRPDDADIHVALAKTLVVLNRPDLAVQQYQQGLLLQPGYVTALVGLGVALAQLGRPEEAIAQYRLALEADPRNAEAHNNLGGTLANQGRIAEALPHFERAVALNPGDENARRNLERARQMLK